MKEYMKVQLKECRKINDELKSVKVDVVTKFVRDEVENSIDNAHDYWIQIKHS